MDWPRVKTLLIVLLLSVNLVLGAVWGLRTWTIRSQEREADRMLCELLEKQNILADPAQIGKERTRSYQWERSHGEEETAARLLLGDTEVQRAGETATLYVSEAGRAEFRMNGELLMTKDSLPADTLDLMRQMGFSEGRGNATDGYVQLLDGLAVFRNVTRLIPDKALRITGRWYWGEALPVSAELCHTAAYCLLHLAEELHSSVPLVLEDLELGFLETQIEPDVILLTPHWRVSLSGKLYYVNALTLEIE